MKVNIGVAFILFGLMLLVDHVVTHIMHEPEGSLVFIGFEWIIGGIVYLTVMAVWKAFLDRYSG